MTAKLLLLSDTPLPHRFSLAGFFGLLIPALVLGIGMGILCPDGVCRIPDMDWQVLAALHAARGPWLDVFFEAVTWLGSLVVLGPACLFLVCRQRDRPVAALGLFLSLAGSSLFALGAKMLVGRPRPDLFPFAAIPGELSFPSGHAAQITAFALGWLLFVRKGRGQGDVLGVLVLIALVASSRVYLQVHFPTDVLAGVGAAAGWAMGLHFLLEGWKGKTPCVQ